MPLPNLGEGHVRVDTVSLRLLRALVTVVPAPVLSPVRLDQQIQAGVGGIGGLPLTRLVFGLGLSCLNIGGQGLALGRFGRSAGIGGRWHAGIFWTKALGFGQIPVKMPARKGG